MQRSARPRTMQTGKVCRDKVLPIADADLWDPAIANREQRVDSWRSFAKGSKKKKKQKAEILG